MAYDTFDTTDTGVFAVTRIGKVDKEKVAQRILKRNLKSLVLDTGYILEAARKWFKIIIRSNFDQNQFTEAISNLNLKEPKFSIFTSSKSSMKDDQELDIRKATKIMQNLVLS